MTVFHIRLLNGDEILTEIIDTTKTTIDVNDPYVLDEVKSSSGQTTIILTKYLLTKDNKNAVRLNRNHIITISEAHEEIERYYQNSRTFNKDIETQKIQEIKRVNDLMEGILNTNQDVIVLKNVHKDRVIDYSSNTVH